MKMFSFYDASIYSTVLFSILSSVYGSSQDPVSNESFSNIAKRDVQTVVRRSLHSSVVIGNYAFIVGGEVTLDHSGTVYGMNDTLVVDMSTSWTKPTAITVLDIPSPTHFNLASMWPDDDGTTGYYFGGERGNLASEPSQDTTSQLYKFVANGNGNGTWSTISNPLDESGNLVNRPVSGLAAYGNGAGYMLGGHASAASSTETAYLSVYLPLVGMVEYNMTTNTWTNNSADGYSASGTAEGGCMEFISNFGPDGLLMPLGGQSYPRGSWENDETHEVSFSNLTVWEPASKTWFNQTATGTIPSARNFHCTVGIASPNNTFEIFLYGGQGPAAEPIDNEILNEVFVLSLPAFVWFQADSTQSARFGQTCHVVGNRQMLSIGGLDPSMAFVDQWNTTDTFPQGLGVFDMTLMQWNDTYNPDAEAYASPDVVQQWYTEHGRTPAAGFSSPEIEKLFTLNTKTTTPSSATTSASSSNPTASQTSSSLSTTSTKSKDTGAIVGGAVGGSVSGIALIAAAVGLFWVFRKRGKNQNSAPVPTSDQYAELNGCNNKSAIIINNGQPLHELPDLKSRDQIPLHDLSEMGVSERIHEMSTNEMDTYERDTKRR